MTSGPAVASGDGVVSIDSATATSANTRTLVVTVDPGVDVVGATDLSKDGTLVTVTVPTGDVAAAMSAINADSDVVSVESDFRMHFTATNGYTNDPLGSSEWSLDQIGWRTSPFFTNVGVIAFLDSGIDANHPDLAGSLPDGRPKVSAVWSTVSDDPNVTDEVGHGTATSSVAAAFTNNNEGIASIAPSAQIMMVKVGDTNGVYLSDAVQGLNWAVAHGARVVNISFASPFDSPALRRAVEIAINNGVTIIAAVGNEGCAAEGEGNPIEYPAAYPHVIGVGASTKSGAIACFSNHGPEVDLAAPGADLPIAVPSSRAAGTLHASSGYRNANGTSFSAPIVAGAVALLKSLHPDWTPAQLRIALQRHAIDAHTPGYDPFSGAGILNLPDTLADASVPASDTIEVNDDVYYAATHPPLLGNSFARASASMRGKLQRNDDPVDVYRIHVRRGQNVRALVKRIGRGSITLTVYKRGTQSVNLRPSLLKKFVAANGRVRGKSLRASFKANRSGIYYITVRGYGTYALGVGRS